MRLSFVSLALVVRCPPKKASMCSRSASATSAGALMPTQSVSTGFEPISVPFFEMLLRKRSSCAELAAFGATQSTCRSSSSVRA